MMKMKQFLLLLILIPFLAHSQTQRPKESSYQKKMKELENRLADSGVPRKWFRKAVKDRRFRIYRKMETYFNRMPENVVKSQERDFSWYKEHFNLDGKVQKGELFINENKEFLQKLEQKNGIRYELVCAIVGIETNFASKNRFLGDFYTFPALVSQYVLMPKREKFALGQLVSLYQVTKKFQKSTYYFYGSYAGACGWGQFIPSSILNYFVDSDGIDSKADIYDRFDNYASIENYLYKHGLNQESIRSLDSLYDGVWSYNPSDAYTRGVIYIYFQLRKLRNQSNVQVGDVFGILFDELSS